MRWSRRDALKSATAMVVGAAASRVPVSIQDDTPALVEFEFTGLFAIQHWMAGKKAGMVLLKGKEAHTPQLLIRQKDIDLDPAQTTLRDFQSIHLGGEPYILWNLAHRLIWVHDVHDPAKSVNYDTDANPSLAFTSQKEWESIDHFVPLAQVVKKKNAHVKKPKKLVAKILLTRGQALGVKPPTKEEYDRVYRVCGHETTFRKYSSQLRVVHPVESRQTRLTLNVATFKPGEIDKPRPIGTTIRKIVLLTPTGSLTRVGVLNTASGHGGQRHFREFFDMCKEKKRALQHKASQGSPSPSECNDTGADDSPYVGCIPPLMTQDAP